MSDAIEAMRKALNYIENTEGEFGIKLSCGDALRDALASQPPAAPVETKPFYGAQCPTYPNCSGGCGLGCTHEVKQHQSCSAGSEPVAWMCEKAIWETVETQRIGGRWLRYLTFDRPAEAEYTRNITPLYSVSPQAVSVREAALEVAAEYFIAKVDRGEARSKDSYAAFKAALALPRPHGECGE